jgi:nucleotide-binding universal stress UspA family protein
MTFVVGCAPDEQGRSALELAAVLARSSGDDLVVCSVVPSPWFPSMARVDAEYHAFLENQAADVLARARDALAPDVTASFVTHRARSAPAGLLELAEKHDARLAVVGSSTAGALGHVTLGSVTDRLLHSSPVPVAVATRGFRAKPDAGLRRVTAAYGGSEREQQLAIAAALVAARLNATLRLASFAVWSRPDYPTRLGTEGEDPVLADWLADMRSATAATLKEVAALPEVPDELDAVVGIGPTWEAALEDVSWEEGDLLAVGSSSVGQVARVFLGSRATKIVRHSPVPVVVVPREATDRVVQKA